MRPSGREFNQLREITFDTNFYKHTDGSCLVKFGNTHVICNVTVDDHVPPFVKGKGHGWITAEYGMLPGSCPSRIKRELKSGPSGRTQEIQRLIGRSLRACVDLYALGERQIIVDCDVLQADGGTRTSSINGAFVALHLAQQKLLATGRIARPFITKQIAAISAGLYAGDVVVDLDYAEDSEAEADGNFVFDSDEGVIEVQVTSENRNITRTEFNKVYDNALVACKEIMKKQLEATEG